MRMKELRGIGPACELGLHGPVIRRHQLDRGLGWPTLRPVRKKNRAVIASAEILEKRKLAVDDVAFPLVPGWGGFGGNTHILHCSCLAVPKQAVLGAPGSALIGESSDAGIHWR